MNARQRQVQATEAILQRDGACPSPLSDDGLHCLGTTVTSIDRMGVAMQQEACVYCGYARAPVFGVDLAGVDLAS